jgi:hypothetical protein
VTNRDNPGGTGPCRQVHRAALGVRAWTGVRIRQRTTLTGSAAGALGSAQITPFGQRRPRLRAVMIACPVGTGRARGRWWCEMLPAWPRGRSSRRRC